MTELGQKQTLLATSFYVRFAFESGRGERQWLFAKATDLSFSFWIS